MLARHVTGAGIELGPGHLPFPLPYPGAKARYVDRWKPDESQGLFPELGESAGFPMPDIVADLNIDKLSMLADESEDFVIASHVLEHLSYSDFQSAIQNTRRMLRKGGVFRLIVPDLEERARKYLQKIDSGDDAASIWFMRATLLGLEKRPRGITGFARRVIGNSAHLWMWDRHSIAESLARAGFVGIRQCQTGDSQIAAFTAVEEEDRFYDRQLDLHECAFEAHKSQV